MVFFFKEKLDGFIYKGEEDFNDGYYKGHKENFFCSLNITVSISNMEQMIEKRSITEELSGTVSVYELGEELPLKEGSYNLVHEDDGTKTIRYGALFTSNKGKTYSLRGFKKLHYTDSVLALEDQLTTVFLKIYEGPDEKEEHSFASGVLENSVADLVELFSSISVTEQKEEKMKAINAFFDFCIGEAADDFFDNPELFYTTGYKSLQLSGKFSDKKTEHHFFLTSARFDSGFPWGEDKKMEELSIVLGDADTPLFERYVFAGFDEQDRLNLEIKGNQTGCLTFKGKMYPLVKNEKNIKNKEKEPGDDGYVYQLSYNDDLADPGKSKLLGKPVQSDITIDFAYSIDPGTNGESRFDFGAGSSENNPFLLYIENKLEKSVIKWQQPGLTARTGWVEVTGASIKLGSQKLETACLEVTGEMEETELQYVNNPKMHYKYSLATDEKEKKNLVHLQPGNLGDGTNDYTGSIFDYAVGELAKPGEEQLLSVTEGCTKKANSSEKAKKLDVPFILEIGYDHLEQGVFQKRIVKKKAGSSVVWACEYDAKTFNLKSIPAETPVITGSPLDLKESLVSVRASEWDWPEEWQNPWRDRPGMWDNFLSLFNLNKQRIKNPVPTDERIKREQADKIELLHQVIEDTGFLTKLEEQMIGSGKDKKSFKIVIKPNFMFLYNKRDTTTYVDPLLIKELVKVLYENGYLNITIVEARSTYGSYFENREVLNVFKYIGADKESILAYPGLENFKELKTVDLSVDEQITPDPAFDGPLKGTKAPRTWAEADYRISFAKNKTHNFSYYTLNIKCIYGALPEQDKFKHYHCDRGIYGTTIEYIKHFPIHFGFIDAYISADGLAGVFSDKSPNYTRTMIGGENIIATSWIGAAKMGLDPMKSRFMQLGVKQFGKPRIFLTGNATTGLYRPWVNSNCFVVGFDNAIDRKELWGLSNIMITATFNTDEKAFPVKNKSWWARVIRFMTKPMRDMTYVQDNDDFDELIRETFGKEVELHSEREDRSGDGKDRKNSQKE